MLTNTKLPAHYSFTFQTSVPISGGLTFFKCTFSIVSFIRKAQISAFSKYYCEIFRKVSLISLLPKLEKYIRPQTSWTAELGTQLKPNDPCTTLAGTKNKEQEAFRVFRLSIDHVKMSRGFFYSVLCRHIDNFGNRVKTLLLFK